MNLPKVLKNPIFSQIGILFSGNVINQIVLIVSYPLITRLYSPNTIGTFEQINALILSVILITTLRFDTTLLISNNQKEYDILYRVAVFVLLIMIFVLTILLIIGNRYIALWLKNPKLTHYMFWIPIFLLLLGLRQILYNGRLKNNNIHRANISDIFLSTGNTVGRIIAGLFYPQVISLFLSRLGAILLSNLSLIRRNNKFRIKNVIKYNKNDYLNTIKKYKSYSFNMSLGIMVNRFTTYFAPLLLSSIYGADFMGIYAIANGTLSIPARFLKRSLNMIYMKEASAQLGESIPIRPMFRHLTMLIIMVGLFPYLLVLLKGKQIYSLILGQTWSQAGLIAQIIVTWVFFSIISIPAISLISVLRLEKFFSRYQIIFFIAQVSIIVIFKLLFESFSPILIGLSFQGAIFNIFLISYVYRKIDG